MATGILTLAPKTDEAATYHAAEAVASRPTAVGYTPNEFSVTPNQTVAKQLDSVIAQDSPLLQQARRRATLSANQAMNDRGLLNSSLATGAATEAADHALYERALPIAQQDASTHATAATNTTNAKNAALYAKMQADNAVSMRGAELDTNVSLANADAHTRASAATADAANRFRQTDMETERAYSLSDRDTARALQLAEVDNASRMALARVDRDTRVELTTIENNYRQLLQTNQDLASMYNQVSTNISNIAASNLSEGAKIDATATQLNLLKQALGAKQAVTGTQATTATTPSGTSAPNVESLNLSSYFQANAGDADFDRAGYDRARNRYLEEKQAFDAAWSRWDRLGRRGPFDLKPPKEPSRSSYYRYSVS